MLKLIFIFKEGTSDILASLAEIEEKKNHAIIYPLPLSEEKEQVYTSFHYNLATSDYFPTIKAMLFETIFHATCNAVLDAC